MRNDDEAEEIQGGQGQMIPVRWLEDNPLGGVITKERV